MGRKQNSNCYTKAFYDQLSDASLPSAEIIVPLILEMVPCRSVVDVGCGNGTWLKIFQEHGIADLTGIDGDHVSRDILVIPREHFLPMDLKEEIDLKRTFDLVLCLEVAEHLPADRAATLVNSLTGLGPVIAFSAAVPYQGGDDHINEQWPAYWIELFKARRYSVIDCIRKKIWNDPGIAYWYRQNLMLFVDDAHLAGSPGLQKLRNEDPFVLPAIHPEAWTAAMLSEQIVRAQISFRDIMRVLPAVMTRTCRRRIKALLGRS